MAGHHYSAFIHHENLHPGSEDTMLNGVVGYLVWTLFCELAWWGEEAGALFAGGPGRSETKHFLNVLKHEGSEYKQYNMVNVAGHPKLLQVIDI